MCPESQNLEHKYRSPGHSDDELDGDVCTLYT